MKAIMTNSLSSNRLFLTAALLFCATPLAAQNIYKCTQGGQLTYTDHPCAGNSGQLIHKADDAEVIDQFLRLGQNDRAQQYAQARHLDALYKERLIAYQQAQQEKADRQLSEEMAARDRAEEAQQQSLADAAARHERRWMKTMRYASRMTTIATNGPIPFTTTPRPTGMARRPMDMTATTAVAATTAMATTITTIRNILSRNPRSRYFTPVRSLPVAGSTADGTDSSRGQVAGPRKSARACTAWSVRA